MKPSAHRDGETAQPDDLEAQAWRWLRLLTSGEARELDAQRFRRWIGASPSHRAAYHDVKRRWDAIEEPARELLRRRPEAATLREPRPAVPLRQRRAFIGAAVSAAAAAGVVVAVAPPGLWQGPDAWQADDHTAAGEQRTVAVPGDVDVTLNTRTSVRREVVAGRMVGLDLLAGEAAIDLRGTRGAFVVVAGAGRSVAESGSFQVRRWDGKVCVTCLEGRVRVEHPAGVRQLEARQQTVYHATSVSGIAGVDPDTASAWRQGMLVFQQTRLADALEEIDRYRPGRVLLLNDAARDKPVSGRFAIASLDLALWQLQEAFDLRARSLPGGLLVLS
ncbi:FecR family protein [Variovorax sp. PDC80]|uniref:FecR family protein n=1 Tax=Variovorax sp. PDC80 TaxID=1882827 RepID=UPI0008F07CA1|nr:FecR domain-containing protein [Variovorax sp. PDC80]SFO70497.1 FecR family protein [Variovorax sp. PDC80]